VTTKTVTEDADHLRYVRAAAEHAGAVAALFERVGCPCFCRYWDFAGDAKQWQNRCANDSDVSRRELCEALTAPEPGAELLALAAFDAEDRCVGWMRLERPSRMDKAYQGRLYRGLPCFDGPREGVVTVACFLVDEPWRERGVAGRLLERGVELARSLGFRAVEALPRRAEGVPAEQHWMGPPSLLERRGFRVVHDFEPYPVLRLEL
jgi:GNAT superfamily N-acetyltransferase